MSFIQDRGVYGFLKAFGKHKERQRQINRNHENKKAYCNWISKRDVMSSRPGTSTGLKTLLTSSTWSMVWLGSMVRSYWGVMGARVLCEQPLAVCCWVWCLHTVGKISTGYTLAHTGKTWPPSHWEKEVVGHRSMFPLHVSQVSTVGMLLFLGLSSSSFLQTQRMEFIPKRRLLVSSDLLPCVFWIIQTRGSMANSRQAWTCADSSRWAWLPLQDPCCY